MKREGSSKGLVKGEEPTHRGRESPEAQVTHTTQIPGFHIDKNKIIIFSMKNIALWELYYISHYSEFKDTIIIFLE